MEKINLDDYFEKSDLETKMRICDSPEDIAEAEEVNRRMREVVRDYRRRAAISWQKARGFVFQNNRVRS